MAEDAEYEILPHQLLSDLKYDVEALKKKLSQPDAKMNELILEIESLKDAIHELTGIFQKALQETKAGDPSIVLQSANEKLQAVISQNETIANGMLAISDRLEEFMNRQAGMRSAPPRASSQPTGRHTMVSGPDIAQRMAPRPDMNADLPPPPPGSEGKKRRGLFQ